MPTPVPMNDELNDEQQSLLKRARAAARSQAWTNGLERGHTVSAEMGTDAYWDDEDVWDGLDPEGAPEGIHLPVEERGAVVLRALREAGAVPRDIGGSTARGAASIWRVYCTRYAEAVDAVRRETYLHQRTKRLPV